MPTKPTLTALLLVLLTACATAPGPANVTPPLSPGFCETSKPITVGAGTRLVVVSGTTQLALWDDSLTDETAKMIEDHNCTGVRLCKWPKLPGDCQPTREGLGLPQ